MTVELEADAVKKLESAKVNPLETLSDVVRRAEFPLKPHFARDLTAELEQRAGTSPLSDDALDCLARAQSEPSRSPSHWTEG
jgi:hypothetical protein